MYVESRGRDWIKRAGAGRGGEMDKMSSFET